MNFHTHNTHPNVDCTGINFMMTIQATLGQLTQAFGKPISTPGKQVTTEWQIRFEDGKVASIYDWKLYTAPHADTVLVWRIGACSREVAQRVHEAFRAWHLAAGKLAA